MGAASILLAEQLLRDRQAPIDLVAVPQLGDLLAELTQDERYDLVARLLVVAARQALQGRDARADDRVLARLCADYQQFGYARQLLRRILDVTPDDQRLRERYVSAIYKDLELPTLRRLHRALDVLDPDATYAHAQRAEPLGLAGAIFKRRWEVEGKVADLEQSRRFYQRGYELAGDEQQAYCGINVAFIMDRLASCVEEQELDDPAAADRWREQADDVRDALIALLEAKPEARRTMWDWATLGEARFGRGQFAEAEAALTAYRAAAPVSWEIETTARQLAEIARLRSFGATAAAGPERTERFSQSDAGAALRALLGGDEAGLTGAYQGKLGLALSGGGYRASLFHLGVLARLAEADVLRHVEVLSCVSGGSIVGAYYYLGLGEKLSTVEERDLGPQVYADLVHALSISFLAAVQRDLRGMLGTNFVDDLNMVARSDYSRTDRAAELLQELFYGPLPKWGPTLTGTDDGWRMPDLKIEPAGRGKGFSPRYENWHRSAKVPVLVLNATTMNTGRNWQFTASWMGEPPESTDERVNANRRLRRVYYGDAPPDHQRPKLAVAVAASASVPSLFPPIRIEGLYDGFTVELSDGGVHDNQGVASLLDQECDVVLVSDASGQMQEDASPPRTALAVAMRANSILMSRVRGAQYLDLEQRRRAGGVRRLMIVHLKKALAAEPKDWIGCQEPYDPRQEEVVSRDAERRAAYGLSESVQRALADLRTDLDAFSFDEAYSLMAAGYQMAGFELRDGLPDFPFAPVGFRPDGGWAFAPMLPKVAEELGQYGPYAIGLRVGRERFGRALRARRAQEPGRFGRLVARVGLTGKAGPLARWTGKVAATPPRWAVGVPLAAVGSVGSAIAVWRHRRRAKRDRST